MLHTSPVNSIQQTVIDTACERGIRFFLLFSKRLLLIVFVSLIDYRSSRGTVVNQLVDNGGRIHRTTSTSR